ncbi:MAG: hypothetical protein AVDCRST_MAG89-4794 [uncultured Gemmatimonadetes bacterium]|uniref:Uncharacterized protein n=1 Tax=uncultured Gemmatimonadota bacterium TaxID=203437 RepID=A0A6J4N531_9BACT|nr:MAG: hypothetical protein AVDCRST_MAG89-4794 [uncultured Gemmatimonadota bacterium]
MRSSRMTTFRPRTRTGAFLLVAALLGGLPVLALPVAVFGRRGFGAYLAISDAYYSLPAVVFGGAHFARREFGMIPTSGPAYLMAGVLYAAIALPLCWLIPLQPAVSEQARATNDPDERDN